MTIPASSGLSPATPTTRQPSRAKYLSSVYNGARTTTSQSRAVKDKLGARYADTPSTVTPAPPGNNVLPSKIKSSSEAREADILFRVIAAVPGFGVQWERRQCRDKRRYIACLDDSGITFVLEVWFTLG